MPQNPHKMYSKSLGATAALSNMLSLCKWCVGECCTIIISAVCLAKTTYWKCTLENMCSHFPQMSFFLFSMHTHRHAQALPGSGSTLFPNIRLPHFLFTLPPAVSPTDTRVSPIRVRWPLFSPSWTPHWELLIHISAPRLLMNTPQCKE